MVITSSTAPRPRALSMLVMLLLPAGGALAADWRLQPSLRLRESYSDNINLASGPLARAEWSTEISPGVSVSSAGPRHHLALDYAVQQILYTRQPDRRNQQLSGSAQAELISDYLYLDSHASIAQQSISAFGPQVSDASQINANNSTVRAYSFSPYFQHFFRGLGNAQLRYAYDRSSSGSLFTAHSSLWNMQLSGDNGGRGWNWDAHASRREIVDANLAPVTMDDAALGLRFPIGGRLTLLGNLGYEKNDYHAIGDQPKGRYWSTGLNWAPSPRTSVNASIGRRFFGHTYSLDAHYRMRTMFWTLNYSEDISTSHEQAVSLPPGQLGAFLFDLWATRIPDINLRTQIIVAFLRFAQMQGSSGGKVNYFSHRYFLQKQWNLASVYSGPKSTLAFGLNSNERTAQSRTGIDSPLLGPDELASDDRIRQRGATAGWSWRANARDSLNVNASASQAISLTNRRRDRNAVLGVGLSRQLRPKMTATVDLRRSWHASNTGGGYHENGVSAALLILF